MTKLKFPRARRQLLLFDGGATCRKCGAPCGQAIYFTKPLQTRGWCASCFEQIGGDPQQFGTFSPSPAGRRRKTSS